MTESILHLSVYCYAPVVQHWVLLGNGTLNWWGVGKVSCLFKCLIFWKINSAFCLGAEFDTFSQPSFTPYSLFFVVKKKGFFDHIWIILCVHTHLSAAFYSSNVLDKDWWQCTLESNFCSLTGNTFELSHVNWLHPSTETQQQTQIKGWNI